MGQGLRRRGLDGFTWRWDTLILYVALAFLSPKAGTRPLCSKPREQASNPQIFELYGKSFTAVLDRLNPMGRNKKVLKTYPPAEAHRVPDSHILSPLAMDPLTKKAWFLHLF